VFLIRIFLPAGSHLSVSFPRRCPRVRAPSPPGATRCTHAVKAPTAHAVRPLCPSHASPPLSEAATVQSHRHPTPIRAPPCRALPHCSCHTHLPYSLPQVDPTERTTHRSGRHLLRAQDIEMSQSLAVQSHQHHALLLSPTSPSSTSSPPHLSRCQLDIALHSRSLVAVPEPQPK
jgi:hypothetical protein